MQPNEKLRKVLDGQKELLREYEAVVREFEANDILQQNAELVSELEKCRKIAEELAVKHKQAESEAESLKMALKEQMLDEKLTLLKISKSKVDAYFGKTVGEYGNQLKEMEAVAVRRLDQLRGIAEKELREAGGEFLNEIDELKQRLAREVDERANSFKSRAAGILADTRKHAEELAGEELSEEIIQKRIRQNNLEFKIGLNLINKIGILLILIGVATAFKYTYSYFFNAHIKGIAAFLTGVLFLAGGEWFARKEKSIFAQGLTGGGIAILYYSVFSSYFMLKIINLEVSLLLSILVTLAAFVLSIRYSSKTICSFALVGGFLPFFSYVFSYGLNESGTYIAMGYLFLLNLLTLLISLNKKWIPVNYISFILNVPTWVFLAFNVSSQGIAILYSIITFSMYLTITLAYPFRHKVSLKALDMILLGLNTSCSCLIIYVLFEKAGLKDYRGLLALVICLVYLGLGQFAKSYLETEKGTRTLFFVTALAFAILIIPFQFGIRWLAMGWLAEGVLLAVYGYRSKSKFLEVGGWIIFLLCIVTFYFVDCLEISMLFFRTRVPFFQLRYLAIMTGIGVVLYVYLRDLAESSLNKYGTRNVLILLYKYFAVFNLWIFFAYNGNYFYNKLVGEQIKLAFRLDDFYSAVTFSLATIAAAYIMTHAPYLADRMVKGFAIFLYLLADLVCITTNLTVPVYSTHSGLQHYFALTVLAVFNVFVFLNLRSIVLQVVRKGKLNLEAYPVLLSIYLLGVITGVLIVQFRLGGVNLLFSLLYIAAAFLFIIYGFKRKYMMMRRLGLGLSVLSTGKLFLYDLAFLNTEGKIVSYFAFGLVLIGISFLYQHFKKAMDVPKNYTEAG